MDATTRAMLKEKKVLVMFWLKALNTTCYTLNGHYLRLGITMTPYEI